MITVPQFEVLPMPALPEPEKFRRSKQAWYRELSLLLELHPLLSAFVGLTGGLATFVSLIYAVVSLFFNDLGLALLLLTACLAYMVLSLIVSHIGYEGMEQIASERIYFDSAANRHRITYENNLSKKLEGWLLEHYGLTFREPLNHGWFNSEEITVKLLSTEGGKLKARLVKSGEAAFELRKSKIHSPLENIYFDTVSNSLTAQRAPIVSALSSGR